METAMWKFPNGDKDDNTWRIQTQETKVIRKLRRRTTATVAGKSDNSNLVYFHLPYSNRFKAMEGLRRLTSREVYYNADERAILTKSTLILTSKK